MLAAASLAEPLGDVEPVVDGEALEVRTSFSGSQIAVQQARRGVPADVVVVADATLLEPLLAGGHLEGEPVTVARNDVVVVARAGADVDTVEDLARPDVRVVLAAGEVPAGGYAREGLEELGLLDDVLPNVAATEADVTAVAGRLRLGEADAGVVYASDASGDARLRVVATLPVEARYAAAVLAGAPRPEAAAAFLRWLRGPGGRDALGAAGLRAA